MNYPLSNEQIQSIEMFLKTQQEPYFYTRIEQKYQEAFRFLVNQKFILDGSAFCFSTDAYKNHLHKAYCISEIIRQIKEENSNIINRIEKDENEKRKNKIISIATLIISFSSLIITVVSLYV